MFLICSAVKAVTKIRLKLQGMIFNIGWVVLLLDLKMGPNCWMLSWSQIIWPFCSNSELIQGWLMGFLFLKFIANAHDSEILKFRTSSPDSISSYILTFFGSRSVTLTLFSTHVCFLGQWLQCRAISVTESNWWELDKRIPSCPRIRLTWWKNQWLLGIKSTNFTPIGLWLFILAVSLWGGGWMDPTDAISFNNRELLQQRHMLLKSITVLIKHVSG